MSEWRLLYYETATGNSPVREYVDGLSSQEAARVSMELDLLQEFGISLGMPHVRPLQGKLYELRVRGQMQHRVLYVALTGQQLLLLTCFHEEDSANREKGD